MHLEPLLLRIAEKGTSGDQSGRQQEVLTADDPLPRPGPRLRSVLPVWRDTMNTAARPRETTDEQ